MRKFGHPLVVVFWAHSSKQWFLDYHLPLLSFLAMRGKDEGWMLTGNSPNEGVIESLWGWGREGAEILI